MPGEIRFCLKSVRTPAPRASKGPSTSWVAPVGIEQAHDLIVEFVLTRPGCARRQPPGTRPGFGAEVQIPGNGRTAAADSLRTTPDGPGRASAALAFHR